MIKIGILSKTSKVLAFEYKGMIQSTDTYVYTYSFTIHTRTTHIHTFNMHTSGLHRGRAGVHPPPPPTHFWEPPKLLRHSHTIHTYSHSTNVHG